MLTLTVLDWIDVFTRENHKKAIVDALKFCITHKGLNVYCYCIMSNHIHLIVNTDEPFQLQDVMRDFKRHTSKTIIDQIKNHPESRREWMLDAFQEAGAANKKSKNNKFWKTGSHAIELLTERFTWDKINYIHNNPVNDGFVYQAEDWKYSSARNYHGLDAVLNEVICVLPMIGKV